MIPSSQRPIPETLSPDRLAASRVRFLADFADGTIGRHHNTYQHRARVLRQLTVAACGGDAGSARDRG